MSETPLVIDYWDQEVFKHLLENLGFALLVLDQEKTIVFANKKASELTGYEREDLLGQKPLELLFALFSPELCSLEKLLTDGQCDFDALLKRKDGTEFFAHLNARLLSFNEKLSFILVTFIDITERKELEKRLFEASIKDPLTGLYNRRFIDEAMKREVAIADRYAVPFSLILIDLDNFKTINDIYGHDVGDKVLVSLSKLLKENLRKADAIARWGGEEFLILLRNTKLSQALEVAEKLRKILCGMEIPPVPAISASFGVAEYKKGEPLDETLKRADLALYKAKAEGKNCVIAF